MPESEGNLGGGGDDIGGGGLSGDGLDLGGGVDDKKDDICGKI